MELIENLRNQIIQNIIDTKDGPFLQAGANQFQSFWTRDFCWASFGLVELGEYSVVKNHLQALLDNLDEDFLVPRILETGRSEITVIMNTILRFLPSPILKSSHSKKVKAEHYGEHGTLSIDSNSLTILAAINYSNISGDIEFLEKNKEKIINCANFYSSRSVNKIILQKDFEDWQDSANRSGYTFYTNLLYFRMKQVLIELGWINYNLDNLKALLFESFFRDELFVSIKDKQLVSSEANYLAIIWGLVEKEQAHRIFQRLNCDEYDREGFPICTYPKYNASEISWTTKVVGLRNYHDDMLWSWILGLKLLAARKLDLREEAKKIESKIVDLNKRDGVIYEIYASNTLAPKSTPLYKSENPFSWGIGIICWALLNEE